VLLFVTPMVASQHRHDLGPEFCTGLIPLKSHEAEQFSFVLGVAFAEYIPWVWTPWLLEFWGTKLARADPVATISKLKCSQCVRMRCAYPA
jgi:hypothetical protein